MSLIEKIKLLFKVQGPITQISREVKDATKTRKWLHFTVTLLGILASTAATLTGVIPPQAQLIVTTVLQALYNIMRGIDKVDATEVKGTLRTTEFWLTALAEVQKGIVATQMGGVNPTWLAESSTIIGLALAAGQNLAGRGLNNEQDPKS